MFGLENLSMHGWIALALGCIFVVVLNTGLMIAIRKSRDLGYDDAAHNIGRDTKAGQTD